MQAGRNSGSRSFDAVRQIVFILNRDNDCRANLTLTHSRTTSVKDGIPFNRRRQYRSQAEKASSLLRSARPSTGGRVSSINSLKGTILVADDNESIREPLTELLRLNCYRVIAVENGEQAFREACSQPVDLVLLDVMMPGPTGFSVCRAIKARPETRFLPVVLITGLACAEDRIRGIEAGADDFLHKPVKNEELLARVRSLVKLKRYTDELENAETVLCSLARSIEAKDPYTEGHCDRLSRYTVSLRGKRLDWRGTSATTCAEAPSFTISARSLCPNPFC